MRHSISSETPTPALSLIVSVVRYQGINRQVYLFGPLCSGKGSLTLQHMNSLPNNETGVVYLLGKDSVKEGGLEGRRAKECC